MVIEHLRPRDRVMAHMRSLMSESLVRKGNRLPTIQQVALDLKVSPSTVQSVFRELAATGEIRTQVGNGTFLENRSAKSEYRIALGAFAPANDSLGQWGRSICMGILAQVQESSVPIDLVTLPKNVNEKQEMATTLLDLRPKVDGLFLFASSVQPEVRAVYEQSGRPVVHANPPDNEATANFVSPNYFGASAQIGRALREAGRRRVAFLAPFLTASASTGLRYHGLRQGLGFTNHIELEVVPTPSYHREDGGNAMRELLRKRNWRPDAICCSGDEVAMGALQAVREIGLAVPDEVSVVGGLGQDLSATDTPFLTRMQQPLERVGREMLKMLMTRIGCANASVPGKYLPSSFIGGATTTAAENHVLGIKSPG